MYETIKKVSKRYIGYTLIFVFAITTVSIDTKKTDYIEYNSKATQFKNEVVYDINLDIEKFILENQEVINFYEESFQITPGFIENKIKEINSSKEIFDKTTVISDTPYELFDHALFYYVVNLMETNPEVFNYNHIPNYDSKDYMLALIDYFAQFYPEINVSITKAIANIESGYNAPTMLYKNNIFGGMSGGKVITYKTMEYGIYKYVSLLNRSYFGQGLTTVSAIGYKYNPTINEAGVKIASPSWVEKVSNNMYKFSKNEITIEALLALKTSHE